MSRKVVFAVVTAIFLMVVSLVFAGSATPPPPPSVTFTFYNDTDVTVKISASVLLLYQKEHWYNNTLPNKFLDVDVDVAPHGSYAKIEVYESYYKGFGAAGSVWYNGQTFRQDCNCPGVKYVTVRALNPLNVSTGCTGGN